MASESKDVLDVKVTFIGGGSRGWVPGMMRDMALCPEVKGHISLYDINYGASRENVKRGEGIFAHPDAVTDFTVSAHRKMGPALDGADFVIMAIQPGPITMMASDIDIPKEYGILQTVGDTAGPAGLVRSLRTVPIYTDYAHAVMEHCPDAWVMNCTNPMATCVAALYAAEPDIKAFGYCHEVFHTQRHLADLVQEHFGVESVPRQDIRVEVTGVNHFTLAMSAWWNGHDLWPLLEKRIEEEGFFDDRTEAALERVEEERWFEYDRLIAYDFLRRFRVLGAAGDRHLVAFVPWYLNSEEELHRWGVVTTPARYRLETAAGRREDKQLEPPEELEPSGGENLEQMLALLGLGDLDTSTNIPNEGQVPGLPKGAVIESNVRFRQDKLDPIVEPKLPPMALALQRRIVEIHQTTLRAALERDRDLAFRALLHDPLVHIGPDDAWRMFNEMLEATADLLPGWDL
ncbi:MAG: alpha-galactosidase [Candidatus Brocadiia bacterium]